MESAMIVALSEIVELDPGVLELWDLPPGWMGVRSSPGAPWHRRIQFEDAAQIHVDWSQIAGEDDFYDAVLAQCGSPSWHGRNLDALRDSWITGGIDRNGPPYVFVFDSTDAVKPDLRSFYDAVLRIAQESVDENGGRFVRAGEGAGGVASV